MIMGLKYCRIRAHISVKTLADRSGVSTATIMAIEKGNVNSSLEIFLKLADALEVPIEALTKEHDDSELEAGDRVTYKSQDTDLNCIGVYRLRKNLSLEQMSVMLGLTREGARQVCISEKPRKKHLRFLAEHEGLTPDEFRHLYAVEEVGA